MYGTPVLVVVVTTYLTIQALSVDPLGCHDPEQRYLPDMVMLLAAGAAVGSVPGA